MSDRGADYRPDGKPEEHGQMKEDQSCQKNYVNEYPESVQNLYRRMPAPNSVDDWVAFESRFVMVHLLCLEK